MILRQADTYKEAIGKVSRWLGPTRAEELLPAVEQTERTRTMLLERDPDAFYPTNHFRDELLREFHEACDRPSLLDRLRDLLRRELRLCKP